MTIDPIGAIGSEQNSDWKLEPLSHALALPPAAGALARVLERPENTAIMDAYVAADQAAVQSQASYLRWSGRAFWCRFLSIACGTASLLDIAKVLPSEAATLGLALQYAFIAASLIIGLMLGIREPFERWMRDRAAAENARLDLFGKITSATELGTTWRAAAFAFAARVLSPLHARLAEALLPQTRHRARALGRRNQALAIHGDGAHHSGSHRGRARLHRRRSPASRFPKA